MRVKIKDIVDFYKKFPDYKGKIDVNTRFGYRPILEAGVTSKNDTVYELATKNGKHLKCSGGHRLFKDGQWVKVKYLNRGDSIHTQDGLSELDYVKRTNKKKDLYDLQVFDVEEYYTNGITSHNSCIIESYYYALFGTTIRDIKKEFVINNTTKGSGDIQLTFDVETEQGINSYRIVRTLKPSAVQLWKVGVDKDEDISKDSIANTNKYICELIGSNPIISKSCDILSLSDNIPFMAKKPEDKRKFIEDIFSLEVFGKMLKDLKEEIKENKAEYNTTSVKLFEIANSLATLSNQYELQKKQNEEREEILNQRKQKIQNEIKLTQDKLDDIKIDSKDLIVSENEKLHDAWNKIDGKIGQVKFKISEETLNKKNLESDYKRNSNVGEAKCDRCLQNIEHTHLEKLAEINDELLVDIKIIEDTLNNLETDLASWHSKKTKVQTKISNNQNILNKIDTQLKEKELLEAVLSGCNRNLAELESDLNQPSPLDSFLENIQDTESRKTESEELLAELKQKTEDLDACKFILGEEGVKSFIIKRLLDMLNTTVQSYITRLGMTMKCKFDEYFDEHITNDKGKSMSYWNFSGAERKTIDVSCAWAFKDMKNKISSVLSNVEFCDEIFDSGVDTVGLEKMIDVLKERIEKNKMSVYVISHRTELAKHSDGECITVQMCNKITTRIV